MQFYKKISEGIPLSWISPWQGCVVSFQISLCLVACEDPVVSSAGPVKTTVFSSPAEVQGVPLPSNNTLHSLETARYKKY